MTQDADERIAELLRADLDRTAPSERDPVFRVQVLARMERARYRRRLFVVGASAAVLAVIAAIGLGVGGAALEAAGALLVAATIAVGYFMVAPSLAQLLARRR